MSSSRRRLAALPGSSSTGRVVRGAAGALKAISATAMFAGGRGRPAKRCQEAPPPLLLTLSAFSPLVDFSALLDFFNFSSGGAMAAGAALGRRCNSGLLVWGC